MKLPFLFWLFLLGPFIGTYAQVSGLRGKLKDKDQGQDCAGALVTLLQHDSTLIQFTRSRKDGGFFFPVQLPPGNYYVLVSHPAYEPFYRALTVRDSMAIDLGVLVLYPKSDSLEAVIVRPAEIRPRLKGDTVEYNTGYIKLRPNAVVEEMLGQLPGLHVDANGTITYNGEKIQQLLVDGEDLFGSDPTIVTRNFDASRIAKVQVLDRKSDQATFTGIDDGSRTKTLNLVLKEDSKHGYFGKVEAGADPEGIYNANGLLASFHHREQFAALGFASNTGTLGFSGDVGGSLAGIIAVNGNDDGLGASAGRGIPHFLASAVHYGNTWDGSKDHLVGNYQYSHLYTQPLTTLATIQTIPDSIYGQQQQSRSVNRQDQHWAYGTYDVVIDSLSAFKFGFHGTITAAQNQYGDTALSTFNGATVNSSQRTIQDVVSRQSIGVGADWRIRARRHADRVFSVSAGWTSVNSATNGYLYSLDRFYQPNGSLQSLDTVDQRKRITNQSLDLSAGLNYTRLLWKKTALGLAYGLSYTGNEALQGTYNKGDGKYQDYVDSLSSHYRGGTLNQSGSVNLQGGDTRLSYTLGGGVLLYSYRQKDLQADSTLHYQYVNLASHARISFTPNPVTHLGIEYTGGTQQPAITQLQPVKNNNDPLHITLGNPNLRPGFSQNWMLNFSRVKAWMFNLGLNLGLATNTISTRTTTDSLGRQVSQPVNVNGGQNAGVVFSINKRLLGLDLGFNSTVTYGRTFDYVNADLNQTDNYTESGGFSVGRYVNEKYSFQLTTQFGYFDTRNSVNATAPVHYWTQSYGGNLGLYFIRGFEIHTDAGYTWQQATSGLAGNTTVLTWNASVSRNFLANRLVLKFLANNLLNQNAGISRSNNGNVNTETSTNILGRYWLMTLGYHFDHSRKNNK